jgi:alpha-D-ribose 1-methylphosphonate 5-triphosphate synthase subunit PhnI
MERKTSFFLMMTGFVFVFIVILYVFNLRAELREVRANQENYEDEIASFNQIEESEARRVNREFLKRFFSYDHLDERYKSIKPYMTNRGYKATHPSGAESPKTDSSISSSISDFKPFEYKVSKTEINFLNEFKVTTEYNDVGSTENILIKTKIIYMKGQGWKVDDVER